MIQLEGPRTDMDIHKRMSFKDAAVEILRKANEPLSAIEIASRATQEGLIQTEGKTPEATMAAQLYVDINKNKDSRFKKVGRGRFSLREQNDSPSSSLFLIEKQNSLVKHALMKKLTEMDAYQFEFLVGDLLKEIGYENVTVTKRSGDKGVDVIANLTMDGITNVKTVIQAKKYRPGNNISGDIITQLRGSAEVDQRGLVITTSEFTKSAIEESKAPNKMPVSLVNGDKLISLMLKYGIGVKKESVDLYSLDMEYFENEEVASREQTPSGKYQGLWPLPGGGNAYVETLMKYLNAIQSGIHSRRKLVQWYKSNFNTVKSDNTANGYINVPKNMGLTSIQAGNVSLTEVGLEVLKSRDIELLYKTISKNIVAFDDIVELIRTSEEPQTESNILEFIRQNFDIKWSSFAQVNFRLIWLVNLGKLKETENGYTLA
jgi:restriction endonuclease Mrr